MTNTSDNNLQDCCRYCYNLLSLLQKFSTTAEIVGIPTGWWLTFFWFPLKCINTWLIDWHVHMAFMTGWWPTTRPPAGDCCGWPYGRQCGRHLAMVELTGSCRCNWGWSVSLVGYQARNNSSWVAVKAVPGLIATKAVVSCGEVRYVVPDGHWKKATGITGRGSWTMVNNEGFIGLWMMIRAE